MYDPEPLCFRRSYRRVGIIVSLQTRYTQDIDFLFAETSDVPVAVGGFSRVERGFQHNRTHIALDNFTSSSFGVRREVANQVIRTVALSDKIRVTSAPELVALKLFRSNMRDRAETVDLIKTGQVDLSGWPLSWEILGAFDALVETAKTDLD